MSFDPNKPFDVLEDSSSFDPSKPFDVLDEGVKKKEQEVPFLNTPLIKSKESAYQPDELGLEAPSISNKPFEFKFGEPSEVSSPKSVTTLSGAVQTSPGYKPTPITEKELKDLEKIGIYNEGILNKEKQKLSQLYQNSSKSYKNTLNDFNVKIRDLNKDISESEFIKNSDPTFEQNPNYIDLQKQIEEKSKSIEPVKKNLDSWYSLNSNTEKSLSDIEQKLNKITTKETDLVEGIGKTFVKATSDFYRTLDGYSRLLSDVTGLPKSDYFKKVVEANDKYADTNLKDLPDNVGGDIVGGVVGMAPLIAETLLPIKVKGFGGATISHPVSTALSFNDFGKKYSETGSLSQASDAALEGYKEGWKLHAMGYVGGKAGEAVGKVTDKLTGTLAGMVASGGIFGSDEALREYLATKKIDARKVAAAAGMGIAFELPKLAEANYTKAVDKTFSSSPEAIESANAINQTPQELREKAAEMMKQASETDNKDHQQQLILTAKTLDAAADIKVITSDIVDDPSLVIKKIEESGITPEEKSESIDKVNRIVADNDPAVKETQPIRDEITDVKSQLKTINDNPYLDSQVKIAQSEPLNKKLNELNSNLNKQVQNVDASKTKEAEEAVRVLTPRAQEVLDNSLKEFESSGEERKVELINKVKSELEKNDQGIERIGMGLDADMVSAGKEFISQVEKLKPIEDAIRKRISEEIPLGETPGDSTEVVGRVSESKELTKEGEKDPVIQEKENFLRKAADLLEKGKLGDITMSGVPFFKETWNGAIDITAAALRAGADVGDALVKGLEYIKNSDWYKGLDEKLKARAEDRFKKHWDESTRELPKGIIETIKSSEKTSEGLKKKVAELDEFYKVLTNKEAIEKSDKRIEKDPYKAKEEVLSNSTPDAIKSVMAIRLIKHFEATKDYDSALELIDNYDKQLREAGRFIQAASLWNKMDPATVVRFATKEATKLGKELPKEVQKTILVKMEEIGKMEEGEAKDKATLEVLNYIADQMPPTKGELFDAFRYQNILSNPRTHMRNIYGNAFNMLISRPLDMIAESTIDYLKNPLNPIEREMRFSGAPKYLWEIFKNIPEASAGFIEAFRNGYISENVIEGGFDKGSIETIRKSKYPKALTVVPRFMEAQDKFFSVLIGQGEKSRLMANGVPEFEATARARILGKKYLLREKLGENLEDQAVVSRAIEFIAKMATKARDYSYITKDGKKVNSGKFVGWFIPFITTPANAAKMSIERSPFGFIGGSYSKEQIARATLGSIVSGVGLSLAMNNMTSWTPPKDKKEKELFYASGRKPFSVKIGDKWVPMIYFGPFSLALALPAALKHYHEDTGESVSQSEIETITEGILSIGGYISSQTALSGIGGVVKAFEGDVDYKNLQNFGMISEQVIPLVGLVKYINTIMDPVFRKAKGYKESIYKDLPVLSKQLEGIQTPDGEDATRDVFNYFMPYDLGKADKEYEEALGERRDDIKESKQEKLDDQEE